MKKTFFDVIIKLMAENKDIYFVSPDLGWPRTDEVEVKFPDRFIWTGASESIAADICAGLSYANKIPVIYTIASFYWRCAETIKLYFQYEKLPVLLVGAGRNDDYSIDHGPSHDCTNIKSLFDIMPNIKQFWPETKEEIPDIVTDMIKSKEPCFLSLKR